MDKKYLDLFNVQEGQLKEVLGIALERGGDYADLYFEYTVSNELSLRDGEVNAASSNIDSFPKVLAQELTHSVFEYNE